jgi:hypothetical protein
MGTRYRNVPTATAIILWARTQLIARFGLTQGELVLRAMPAKEMLAWAYREGV